MPNTRTPTQSADAVRAGRIPLRKGDEVAFNVLNHSTRFTVEAVQGFKLLVREPRGSERQSDISLIRQHWPKA